MIWFWNVMLKLTLVNSRLEIPQTNYVVQCTTVPNNNTIAIMYMYIRIWSPLKITRNLSRARKTLSPVNLAGFTMLTSVWNSKYPSSKEKQQQHAHTHANFFKNWLCRNFSFCPKTMGPYTYGWNTYKKKRFPSHFYSVLIRHMRFIRITHKLAIHFVTINNNNNNNNNI